MPAERAPEVERFWREFCAAAGADPNQRVDVFAFGDSPELADELLGLVLHGPKRATASLAADFERDGSPLPEVDVYSIVLDGAGHPACVLRTTEVEVKPMDQVDESFAWEEGEDDRTRASWLRAHRRFFTRETHRRGEEFTDDVPTVFERFRLVWPADA